MIFYIHRESEHRRRCCDNFSDRGVAMGTWLIVSLSALPVAAARCSWKLFLCSFCLPTLSAEPHFSITHIRWLETQWNTGAKKRLLLQVQFHGTFMKAMGFLYDMNVTEQTRDFAELSRSIRHFGLQLCLKHPGEKFPLENDKSCSIMLLAFFHNLIILQELDFLCISRVVGRWNEGKERLWNFFLDNKDGH